MVPIPPRHQAHSEPAANVASAGGASATKDGSAVSGTSSAVGGDALASRQADAVGDPQTERDHEDDVTEEGAAQPAMRPQKIPVGNWFARFKASKREPVDGEQLGKWGASQIEPWRVAAYTFAAGFFAMLFICGGLAWALVGATAKPRERWGFQAIVVDYTGRRTAIVPLSDTMEGAKLWIEDQIWRYLEAYFEFLPQEDVIIARWYGRRGQVGYVEARSALGVFDPFRAERDRLLALMASTQTTRRLIRQAEARELVVGGGVWEYEFLLRDTSPRTGQSDRRFRATVTVGLEIRQVDYEQRLENPLGLLVRALDYTELPLARPEPVR